MLDARAFEGRIKWSFGKSALKSLFDEKPCQALFLDWAINSETPNRLLKNKVLLHFGAKMRDLWKAQKRNSLKIYSADCVLN